MEVDLLTVVEEVEVVLVVLVEDEGDPIITTAPTTITMLTGTVVRIRNSSIITTSLSSSKLQSLNSKGNPAIHLRISQIEDRK